MQIGKAALLLAAGIAPFAAHAETEIPADKARADRQADYAAVGFQLLGLRAFPRLTLGYQSTSNIFRTRDNAVTGNFLTAAPGLTIQSDWNRHALKLDLSAESYRYRSLPSEDRTDWHAGMEGRIDITRPFRILASIAHDVRHEERGAPDAPGNAANPTRYRVDGASAELDYKVGRFGFQASFKALAYDWDATNLTGLAPRSNDDRNRTDLVGDLKASFEFSPGYEIFLRYAALNRDFDLEIDRSGVNRDVSENTLQAGLTMEITTLLVGEVFGGYSRFRFSDPLFDDLATFDFGATLRWYPTELTTLRLAATRSLEPTTIVGVSGTLTTSYTAKVEHELLRNLILVAGGSYTTESFKGSTREDEISSLTFEAHYFLNRHVALDLFGAFTSRDSTLPSAGYDDRTIGIRTELKL